MTAKKYKTDKELKKAIEEYFKNVNDLDENPTITGLAYHLGFESRQSFYHYEQYEDHLYTMKRARLKIESLYENRLFGTTPTGAIFALKNLGWDDKQQIDNTHSSKDGGPVEISVIERVIVDAPKNTNG